MKKTLFSLSLLLTGYCGFAQYEGFENWTLNSVLQLDDYETSINELGAFGNDAVSREMDAVDGTYSIKLQTITMLSDTVTGYFISGDPNTFTPGQQVTINNVDSVIGYYKYDILPGDSVTFIPVTFFAGIPTGPASMSPFYITSGTQSTWKRFAYYIGASFADSLLIGAATGDPLNDFNGIPGSWIQFDNIQLKSSFGTMQNIVNHSFENWTPINWDEPNGWMTANQWAIGNPTLPAVKSTDMYSGNFALELNTITNQFGDTIEGMATNGIFGMFDLIGGTPFSSKPDAISFYYKYIPSGTDSAFANIVFKSGGTPISYGGQMITSSTSNYTVANTFLSWPPSTPDTVLFAFGAGKNPGSQLLVDHIDFVYPVGINENIKIDRLESYPNPTTDVLNIRFELKNSNVVSANLLDVTGKVLTSKSFGNLASGTYNESFNTSSFTSGIYFIEFTIGEEKIVNRFMVK